MILHGCTVGDRSLIGMGAILLNGARIGANCIVGAGARDHRRQDFAGQQPIVGAPGREIRTLDEGTRQGIAKAAEIYFQRWQHYAATLKRVP